jgi:hypothetical protein
MAFLSNLGRLFVFKFCSDVQFLVCILGFLHEFEGFDS